jgi:hypothetical protein
MSVLQPLLEQFPTKTIREYFIPNRELPIDTTKLSRLIGTAGAPTLIDVRLDEDFSVDPERAQKSRAIVVGLLERSRPC